MGAFQLPDSVLGDAVGCLIYSFICLIANAILVWLVWTHNERKTYIAFIAYFTLITTTSSIIQQLYDYILWRDLMIEQYYYGKEHSGDAEVQYQKGIFGVKLGLAYIRLFSFTVESTLVFFFSFSLTATVYGWWAKNPNALRIMSITGRSVPVVLTTITIILLQLNFTHKSFTVYMVIANAQFLISVIGACIFLLMILAKYMQTRRQLKTWDGVRYGKGASSTGTSGMRSFRSRANSNRNRSANGSFDNWLVIRLSIALVMLGVFEYTTVGSKLSARGHVVESAYDPAPDLSRKRALDTVRGYLSGVSPSLLSFIVFGTTKTFQKKMYKTFVPRFLRRRLGRGRGGDDDDMFTCRNPAQLRLSTSNLRASAALRASTAAFPPPPRTPGTPGTPGSGTYVGSLSAAHSLKHQDSGLSVFKPEPAALVLSASPPGDEHDRLAELGGPPSRFHYHPRRSQIGLALSELPPPLPRGRSGGSSSTHTRVASLPPGAIGGGAHAHGRHPSFSRPTSRSVDHGTQQGPLYVQATAATMAASPGRGRSGSRGGAFSRDGSRDSTSSRAPISRFSSGAAHGAPGYHHHHHHPEAALLDDDSGGGGVSMTTIWSDATAPPRRGSKGWHGGV